MRIDGLTVLCYKTVVYRNAFACYVFNPSNKKSNIFTIGFGNNDLDDLINCFKQKDVIFCGFGNKYYDNPLINYIIGGLPNTYDIDVITYKIHKLSSDILYTDSQKWKTWKYFNAFKSIDLKKVSKLSKDSYTIKDIQFNIGYYKILDYKDTTNKTVECEQFYEDINVLVSDVYSIYKLLKYSSGELNFRYNINSKFNVNIINKDNSGIGMELMKNQYIKRFNINPEKLPNNNTNVKTINIGKLLVNRFDYSNDVLQKIFNNIIYNNIDLTKKLPNKHFYLNGIELSISPGSIHSINKPESIIPSDDESLLFVDMESAYPTIMVNYNIFPKHLNNDFLRDFSNIYTSRLKAKENNEEFYDKTLKEMLVSFIGHMNKKSWVYDPETYYKIKINIQLLLMQLIDNLIKFDCKLVNVNTDGIFFVCKKSVINNIDEMLTSWKLNSRMRISVNEYNEMHMLSGNDYILNGGSELILKGKFNQTNTPKIIINSVINNLLYNKPVTDTLSECDNLSYFMTYCKTQDNCKAEYNNNIIQKTNRFYYSTDGYYIYSVSTEGKYTNVTPKSGVTLTNTISKEMPFPQNINYKYYESEANVIIEQLKSKQLSLF